VVAPSTHLGAAHDLDPVDAMTPTIKVYPADMGGCGFYRTIWPGQELTRQGATVEVILPTDPEERQLTARWREFADGSREVVSVVRPEADVVVMQRPLQQVLADSIPILQAMGVRVVVEIDDDFEAISARNVSWSAVDPKRHPERNRDHLRRACERADLVVCSTPALAARYGAHGRVRVVRNRVPAWYLAVEREPHDGVYVGWSGSIETHPDDLQVTGGGVMRALRTTDATFAVIGTGKGVRKALGLGSEPVACGWVPIERYPYMLAQLDVGIVPLELTPFNQAKSALKMMEMAALGVVPIVSPTEENGWLHMQGVGINVLHPRGWEGAVKQLVKDEDYRIETSERGRLVMRDHTIEGNAGEWFDAWAAAVNTPAKEYAP
jgi:hypothetical protein